MKAPDPEWLPSLPDIDLYQFRKALESLDGLELLDVEAHCRRKRAMLTLEIQDFSEIYRLPDWAQWSVLVEACGDERIEREFKLLSWGFPQ